MSDEKATCQTCMYWRRHETDVTESVPRLKIASGSPRDKLPEPARPVGQCMYSRPSVQIVPVPNAIARTMEVGIQCVYPNTFADSTCADHPKNAAAREYHHEQCRESARRAMPEYSPEKFGETNAGFSSPPSLADAKRIATVAQQCPCQIPELGNTPAERCTLERDHDGAHIGERGTQWHG